jgi:hypothetical protein
MGNKNVILTASLLFVSSVVIAQRQFIILKDQTVIARYQKGDVIRFARSTDKGILVQRILDLNDSVLMMNQDTLAYYRIQKMDIDGRHQNRFLKGLGFGLLAAGILLPGIDYFNSTVVQDQSKSVNDGLLITSAGLIGTGAALMLIKKKYFKPGRRNRMMIIDKRSPFYREKSFNESFESPFIPKN